MLYHGLTFFKHSNRDTLSATSVIFLVALFPWYHLLPRIALYREGLRLGFPPRLSAFLSQISIFALLASSVTVKCDFHVYLLGWFHWLDQLIWPDWGVGVHPSNVGVCLCLGGHHLYFLHLANELESGWFQLMKLCPVYHRSSYMVQLERKLELAILVLGLFGRTSLLCRNGLMFLSKSFRMGIPYISSGIDPCFESPWNPDLSMAESHAYSVAPY